MGTGQKRVGLRDELTGVCLGMGKALGREEPVQEPSHTRAPLTPRLPLPRPAGSSSRCLAPWAPLCLWAAANLRLQEIPGGL